LAYSLNIEKLPLTLDNNYVSKQASSFCIQGCKTQPMTTACTVLNKRDWLITLQM